MSTLDNATIDRLAETWRTEGWVLVEDLIDVAVIDAAVEEMWSIFAPPTVFRESEADTRVDEFFARRDRDLVFVEPTGSDPAFRPEQLLGTREFPFPAAPRLNALTVHPDLLTFVRAGLGADDVRLYLAQLWAKYTGVVDYEQPLHRDPNHSLVPPRSTDGWSQMEGFLYLNDVLDDSDAPTRLVSRRIGGNDPARLAEHEVAATGRRGSFLAYHPDVWHRATNLTRPGGARFVLAASFKHAAADWIGFTPIARNAPNFWFQQLVADATPVQLAVLGFPGPGHPYWTRPIVDEFARMYPGLDVEPWIAALDHTAP